MSTPGFRNVAAQNFWSNNPIFIQILGICSTLAVTNNLMNTTIMAAGVMFTTAFSNLTLSALKKMIPQKVRMIVQVLVIAFYVILVDLTLKAFLPDASRTLGPYVGLIITNCIIMGRAEAFARSNPMAISFWDGLTSGAGYMTVLLAVALVREVLGLGTFFNIKVIPDGFLLWTIMVTAPSAFFLLGIFIWIVKSIMLHSKKEKKS
ncbi:MAG: NADH:ubiquinone reductase (Na(+)-transporting) subunit D [Spirochaetaceae bacterium]|nr:MAG: NADH:ubiquinone reductase (Na(+)-transporting) subunit D [Spirochaetaceae bacterium]